MPRRKCDDAAGAGSGLCEDEEASRPKFAKSRPEEEKAGE